MTRCAALLGRRLPELHRPQPDQLEGVLRRRRHPSGTVKGRTTRSGCLHLPAGALSRGRTDGPPPQGPGRPHPPAVGPGARRARSSGRPRPQAARSLSSCPRRRRSRASPAPRPAGGTAAPAPHQPPAPTARRPSQRRQQRHRERREQQRDGRAEREPAHDVRRVVDAHEDPAEPFEQRERDPDQAELAGWRRTGRRRSPWSASRDRSRRRSRSCRRPGRQVPRGP